jgi:hypothetical protein
MRTADSELIQQLQRKMRKLDLYLINHVNPEVLSELNGTNERAFFGHQVHEIFLKTAQAINGIWQLNLDLSEISDAEGILDVVLAELTKKLKNQPPKDSAEALRCIEDIIHLESITLRNLADDIKKEIKAEQSAEFYRTLTQPFTAIWGFIYDSISNLVNNVVLYFQTQAGVDFQNIQQSTHLACVHKSVTRSLNLLDARNPRPTDVEMARALEKRTVKEIELHIKAMDLSADQKDYAFNTLLRAKDDRAPEPHSGRTIMETLITMWVAAKDSSAYSPEDSERDINSRKDLIINHLVLADREYNMDENGMDLGGKSKPACLGGTVNKIVEALEIIHPDVRIIRGQSILADFCKEVFEAEFIKLSDAEQVMIYSNKDPDKASILMDGIKSNIETELNKINDDIFDGEVSKKTLDEYLANIQYLAIPETDSVRNYREEAVNKSDDQSALSDDKESGTGSTNEKPGSSQLPKIVVDGHEVTDKELTEFDKQFTSLRNNKMLEKFPDLGIAKRAVKAVMPHEFWYDDAADDLKENNIQELAEKLLEHRNTPVVSSVSTPNPPQPAKIVVDGHEVTDKEFLDFNTSFGQLIKLMKASPDIQIAKRCVKSALPDELWDKDDNLQQLAEQLLERRNEGLANKQKVQNAAEVLPVASENEHEEPQYVQGMK